MARGTRLRRKISVKTVTGLDPNDMRDIIQDGPVNLFTVVGVARAFQKGTSDYGEWIALIGEFEATNVLTGEVHNGGRCFMPRHVTDLVMPAFGGSESDAAVEFAIMVGVEKADNNFGYEYTADTYLEPEKSDRMASLRGMLPAPAKAIEGKKVGEKP